MLAIVLLYIAKVPIENIFGFDIYPIIAILFGIIILKSLLKANFSKDLFYYISILLVSTCISIIYTQNIADNFNNMVYILLLQPIAVILLTTQSKVSYASSQNVLQWISFISIISFLGAIYFYLVHFLRFPDPYEIFAIEFTRAGERVVLRNPSFYGLSLIFCGVTLITFLSSAYLHYELGKSKFLILEILSILCVFMSLSRRGLLPIMIFYTFLFFFKFKFNTKIKFFITFLIVILILISTQPLLLEIAYDRVSSIFDISNDKSNISRVTLMAEGAETVLLNPLGTGLGTLSAIGYTVEEVKALEYVRVTESSIITLIGEIGLIGSVFVALLLAKKASAFRRMSRLLYISPLLVESIVGLGILNPFVSVLTLLFLTCTYRLERCK